MSCFRQPLAFLFLFITFCGLAWSRQWFTSLPSTITDSSAALTPGATVTTLNNVTNITSSQAASDQLGNKHVSWGAYE
jgi:uncharacterized iron-regulated membrane protein